MSQDPDAILKNSLDAVDRYRTRMLVAIVIAVLLSMATFLHFGHAFLSGDVPRMMHLAVISIVVWTLSLTFVIVHQMTIMTKRILRAIELASKRSE